MEPPPYPQFLRILRHHDPGMGPRKNRLANAAPRERLRVRSRRHSRQVMRGSNTPVRRLCLRFASARVGRTFLSDAFAFAFAFGWGRPFRPAFSTPLITHGFGR